MKRTFIPSDDVYTYEKQALDMLPKSHPHYEEVYAHLYDQVRDQLNDICNTRANRSADTVGEDTDFAGSEETQGSNS